MTETAKIDRAETDDRGYELLLAEETLILDAQIAIQRVLNEKRMTQAQLAKRLDVGESYVSQLLGDSARNLTLRTIARVMKALGETPMLTTRRYAKGFEEPVRPYDCSADFGPWGELVELQPDGVDLVHCWSAREWAANENSYAPGELAQAA